MFNAKSSYKYDTANDNLKDLISIYSTDLIIIILSIILRIRHIIVALKHDLHKFKKRKKETDICQS